MESATSRFRLSGSAIVYVYGGPTPIPFIGLAVPQPLGNNQCQYSRVRFLDILEHLNMQFSLQKPATAKLAQHLLNRTSGARQNSEVTKSNSNLEMKIHLPTTDKFHIDPFHSPYGRRAAQLAYAMAEVLMGTAILGVMMVSLYGGMSSGFAVTQLARENLRGTQIMLERTEGVRLYNWNQLVYSNMIPTSFTAYYYPLATGNDSRGVPYAGTLSITTPALSPPVSYVNDMRLITVAISWTNTYGKQKIVRSRQMQTYVGRMGMQNYIYNN